MILPHAYVSSALKLDAGSFKQLGIEGLLLDIDGTLKDFSAPSVPPATIAWLAQLREAGLRLCLYSNGRKARISGIAAELGLPYVAEAMKPWPHGCRRGLAALDLPAERVAVVGDQIFADILAGRLARLYTVLVQPTSRIEPWFTRLKRPFEAPILFLLRGQLDHFVTPS